MATWRLVQTEEEGSPDENNPIDEDLIKFRDEGGHSLALIWILMTVTLVSLALVIEAWAKCAGSKQNVPTALADVVHYGKVRPQNAGSSFYNGIVQVPKRYFWHFYLLGFISNLLLACVTGLHYFWDINPPFWLRRIVFNSGASSQHGSQAANGSPAVIAICMLCIHLLRRLCECLFVSIYNPSQTIHMGHYLLGYLFYFMVGPSILCESYSLTDKGHSYGLGYYEWLCLISGVLLYVYASWHHHLAHVNLAALRRPQRHLSSSTVSRYAIPTGDWFQYVSCPHYFAEIIIYCSFVIMLGAMNMTMWCCLAFVFVNQVYTGYEVHQWYRTKFEGEYPSHRKAIIPFVL